MPWRYRLPPDLSSLALSHSTFNVQHSSSYGIHLPNLVASSTFIMMANLLQFSIGQLDTLTFFRFDDRHHVIEGDFPIKVWPRNSLLRCTEPMRYSAPTPLCCGPNTFRYYAKLARLLFHFVSEAWALQPSAPIACLHINSPPISHTEKVLSAISGRGWQFVISVPFGFPVIVAI